MATLYGKRLYSGMTTSQNTSTSSTSSVKETNELKKYRSYWWKTGNIHSKAEWEKATLPYKLVSGITYDTYVEQTDKHNIHGWWEWENGTVRVLELPTAFHESCVGAVTREITVATLCVRSTDADILSFGSTTTRSRGSGKEADASFIPFLKPRMNRGGSDSSGTQPWPNLVVEVAYTQSETDIKKKVENYWLRDGRAHDVIMIKLEQPIASATVPTIMTAWHYCKNNHIADIFNTTMYEFGTVDRSGNFINFQPGQKVININLNCLYHDVNWGTNVFVIPSPPLPNPIPIDLFHVQWAIRNCLK